MYGFVLEQPDHVDTIVKIGHYESRDNAVRALHVYARDWAIIRYGIDVSPVVSATAVSATVGTPTVSTSTTSVNQIAVETVGESVHIRRYVEKQSVGVFYTTTDIVQVPIALFKIISSECVGHSDHSKLVNRIADEAIIASRHKADLDAEVVAHTATRARLAEVSARIGQSGSAFAELLAEYTTLQGEHVIARNERNWLEMRLGKSEESLNTVERELQTLKSAMRERKNEYRAYMNRMQSQMQTQVERIRSECAGASLGADHLEAPPPAETIGRAVAAVAPPVSIGVGPHEANPMSLSSVELIQELTTKRPRLKTREERDLIRAQSSDNIRQRDTIYRRMVGPRPPKIEE